MKRHIFFLALLPWILGAEVRPALMPLPKKMVVSPGALRIDTKFRVAFASQPEARLERAVGTTGNPKLIKVLREQASAGR